MKQIYFLNKQRDESNFILFFRLLYKASRYELDFKKSFFGSHYNKLRLIKDKYDPNSLFIVHSGVGSEDWDEELVCTRRRRG